MVLGGGGSNYNKVSHTPQEDTFESNLMANKDSYITLIVVRNVLL